MKINSFISKLIIVFTALALTFFYAKYERNKFYSKDPNLQNDLALKYLPSFTGFDVYAGKNVNSLDFLKGANGVFVHLWGSWCAPCEEEMPDFLNYALSVQDKGIKFILVAVNDEDIKIKKFMARFKVPTNVTIVNDKQNIVMDLFGTFKVPESFLFDSTGKHINKFVGPQDWAQESYKSRLEFWLNIQNLVERKIPTH